MTNSTITHYPSVYVFNTGEITAHGEEQIRVGLPKEQAANTHFFGGKQLELLANVTFQAQDKEIRVRLMGLRSQLELNIHVWTTIRGNIRPDAGPAEQTWDVRGPILHGFEEFLTRPVVPDQIGINDVAGLWQEAKIIQGISMRHLYRDLPLPQDRHQAELKVLVEKCDSAINLAGVLMTRIEWALQALPTPFV